MTAETQEQDSDAVPSEEEIRENATTEEVSQQNGPVPREQIEARYGAHLIRGDTEEEALDKLVKYIQEVGA